MPKGRYIKNATEAEKLDELRKRLELFSEPVPFSGCMIYMGFIGREGYGLITYNYKSISAHRASYLVNVGLIPNGAVIMHTCDVKSCINPNHLRLGTQTDNMRDMQKKGRSRYLKGEETTLAKLTEDRVRYIRSSYDAPSNLAKLFGVSPRTIRDAKNNITWKHLL